MALAKTQEAILQRLKARGPQSIKILANQLDITTMGIRQHVTELQKRNLVVQTASTRQTRGRPVHLWQLSAQGHRHFPDSHAATAVQLINGIRNSLGESALQEIIASQTASQQTRYARAMADAGTELGDKLNRLAQLRSEEGFMAEIRLLPDGWMLIENHCPIFSAAGACQHYCQSELLLFQQLLSDMAKVERTDHVLAGARRCAYKIQQS